MQRQYTSLLFFVILFFSGLGAHGIEFARLIDPSSCQMADSPDNRSHELAISEPRLMDKGITQARFSVDFQNPRGREIQHGGFCWSRESTPNRKDHFVRLQVGAEGFSGELSQLKKATVYYVRAYVMADSAIFYGKQHIFTTHGFFNGARIPLTYVEGGTFQMGCTAETNNCYGDETPVHRVQVRDFRISPYEVTCNQYCAFLNQSAISSRGTIGERMYVDIMDSDALIRYSGGKFIPNPGKGDHPMTEVTWYGAQAFCEWLGGRLPTEAEWEYAARGGAQQPDYKYSGSDQLKDVGWFNGNSGQQTHPVGQKAPNELGLYDMSGNVWEWCYDWYGFDYYGNSPVSQPMGPNKGSAKVIRGGAWNMDPWNCRISNRYNRSPKITYKYYGFRLVIPEG